MQGRDRVNGHRGERSHWCDGWVPKAAAAGASRFLGGTARSGLIVALLALPLAAFAADRGGDTATAAGNDYPTSARADYVFGCMAVNGQSQEMLDRCSCAIDVVASILPYKDYVAAETVLRMQQEKSFLAMEFKTAAAKQIVRRLREAEAEGEMRCF